MDFWEARRHYRELGKQYFAGQLSRSEYHTEVRNLDIKDDRGRRWRIDSSTGTWQRLENDTWITDDPDGPLPAYEEQVADDDVPTYTAPEIPGEVVFGLLVVFVVMVLAAGVAYYFLNATR